jgi:2-polyprenyl-6-methoxyphenol hydroxylase-like FAD-dependent oxidoreductase
MHPWRIFPIPDWCRALLAPPNMRKLVEMISDDGISVNRLRTSRPMPPWKTSPITLLGDAIHSITPYRGIGANIALKDAALLASKLIEADRGEKPLLDAIGKYETALREYAFAAVEDSRKSMEQAVREKRYPMFGIAKTVGLSNFRDLEHLQSPLFDLNIIRPELR